MIRKHHKSARTSEKQGTEKAHRARDEVGVSGEEPSDWICSIRGGELGAGKELRSAAEPELVPLAAT
jgi:hypothetical protein